MKRKYLNWCTPFVDVSLWDSNDLSGCHHPYNFEGMLYPVRPSLLFTGCIAHHWKLSNKCNESPLRVVFTDQRVIIEKALFSTLNSKRMGEYWNLGNTASKQPGSLSKVYQLKSVCFNFFQNKFLFFFRDTFQTHWSCVSLCVFRPRARNAYIVPWSDMARRHQADTIHFTWSILVDSYHYWRESEPARSDQNSLSMTQR